MQKILTNLKDILIILGLAYLVYSNSHKNWKYSETIDKYYEEKIDAKKKELQCLEYQRDSLKKEYETIINTIDSLPIDSVHTAITNYLNGRK